MERARLRRYPVRLRTRRPTPAASASEIVFRSEQRTLTHFMSQPTAKLSHCLGPADLAHLLLFLAPETSGTEPST